jgi:uridine monophosphate synthetase
MKTFYEILEERARQIDSLLCVGLDPHPADLPAPTAEAAGTFCLRLIEATSAYAAAFKPNAAFFEAFGAPGVAVLQQVIAAVPPGIPVILDAKRGDIASTAEAYARAAFEALGATALTVNPYLGEDAVQPFLSDPGRGAFLLCRTSNPGAGDLQDRVVQDLANAEVEFSLPGNISPPSQGWKLFEIVALLARRWNRRGNLGLVVGATYPEELRRVRALAPELWILAPGVGTQGGDLKAALRAGLRADGLGLLLPVSRAISRAPDPKQAARALREAINREKAVISEQVSVFSKPEFGGRWSPAQFAGSVGGSLVELADALLEAGCVKFGQFRLKSGLQSPIYLDLRLLVSVPEVLARVGAAYLPVLRGLAFDRLAALPYAALPIATAISLQGGWPLVYPRKEAKTYGTKAEIEGAYAPGERVVVIDDLATTGGSKFEAIEKLTAAGLQVSDVVVLIDRQSGAAEGLAQVGVRLHAVLTLAEMLDHWEQSGRIPAEQIAAARSFLKQ